MRHGLAEKKASETPKRRRKKKAYQICVNLSNCKYEVVRLVLKKLSWKEAGDDDPWHIYWTDTSVTIDRVMRLSKTQKINHFSGMLEICRKKRLSLKMWSGWPTFPMIFVKGQLIGGASDLAAQLKSGEFQKHRKIYQIEC